MDPETLHLLVEALTRDPGLKPLALTSASEPSAA